jgi:hypothetical protein
MTAGPIRAAREELAEMVRRARPSLCDLLHAPDPEPQRTARGDGYSRSLSGVVLRPERWRDAPAPGPADWLVPLPGMEGVR